MALPFTLADALRACLDGQWDAEDPDRPAEICHRPGQEVPLGFGTSQDECCTGLAWVRIVSVTPLTAVGVGGGNLARESPCHTAEAEIVFELGVARCAPFGTAASGPTCDQWTSLALLMDEDAARMRRSVCCFDQAAATDPDYAHVYQVRMGAWVPLAIEGQCAGGSMEVTVHTTCTDC